MIAPSKTSRRAFTLIELLVVIAILAILMTLLFPAVNGAFDAVKKTQAKNDVSQIATAISAYITEYGKVPIADGTDQEINTPDLMNLLSGQNFAGGNPRQIVFLEVPRAKSGTKSGAASGGGGFTSGYLDPYGNQPYKIMVDGDYDNKIKAPDGSGDIRKTVIVWSIGKPKGSAQNTDATKFIKSWE